MTSETKVIGPGDPVPFGLIGPVDRLRVRGCWSVRVDPWIPDTLVFYCGLAISLELVDFALDGPSDVAAAWATFVDAHRRHHEFGHVERLGKYSITRHVAGDVEWYTSSCGCDR